MSLKRPTPATVKDDFQLLDVLAGFYDRLVELARPSLTTTVTQTFAATTDTKVFHGLGHVVTEWWVVNKNSDANIWQSQAENTAPALYIILQSSAITTASLRFA